MEDKKGVKPYGSGSIDTSVARDGLSDTLNRVSYGKERIVIRRHGKGIAALVPMEDLEFLEELEDRVDLEEARTALAEAEASDMTSYYEFSSLIKNGFDYDERVKVIEMLWEVAHADGRIDTYEEHMIRKIAGLLYVKREDVVSSKHSALSHHQQAGQ